MLLSMKAPTLARILGIAFLLAGIAGFIPFAVRPYDPSSDPFIQLGANYGLLAGLFPVNALHDGIHVIFGLWGLIASFSFKGAVRYCRTVAVIYLVLVVFGAIPLTNTAFGAVPIYGWDVLLHLLIAVLALYGGFGAGQIPPPTEEAPLLPPPPIA